MTVYHSTDMNLDYLRARSIADEHKANVESQGGTLDAPNAPVQTPAILVLTLPDGVAPEGVIPDVEFIQFTEGVQE